MLAIINDILDISKIETGQLQLEVAEFDLQELVERACVPAGLEAQAKGVALEIQIDPTAPRRVRGDGARVRQVLLNLVGNAVKFTAHGAVAVRVRRREPGAGDDSLLLEVVDSGIGVDPERVEQMFQPFVQADVSTTREYGGNGLGLAIAKELVELMGGTIGAVSQPGRGSTFWFELPLPEVATSVAPPSRNRVVHLSGRRGDPDAALVLVVEDSPVNRLVAVHVLERCGFRAHVVNDGREALQALSSQHYDAVLMDCQMPDIDGYEATRELRRREGVGRHTPVIAMTAHAMTGSPPRATLRDRRRRRRSSRAREVPHASIKRPHSSPMLAAPAALPMDVSQRQPLTQEDQRMSTPMRAVRGNPTELAFTSSQAATYLGVSLATVRRWSNDGHLRGYRTPGGQRRFSRVQLDAFLRSLSGDDHGGEPAAGSVV
jgi:excisionase family DNA binding protein